MKSKKRYTLSVLYTVLILCCFPLVITHADTVPTKANAVQEEKIVSVYLLINSPEMLQHYVIDLARIKKPNFNRVIFAFVRPTLIDYESGSLADTGLLNYYNDHNGKGAQAFNALKAAIDLSKEKNIQTFLSVGGWNYSCNLDLAKGACGIFSPASTSGNYDWFPDPTDEDEASKALTSYANLVKLANDLGVNGIDFNYEELWYADKYAISWGPSANGEWSTQIAQNILHAGGPTYNNLMKYGTNSGPSYVMPKSVDKVDAILHALIDNPGAKYLRFSITAPPRGGRPITGFVTGDRFPDIDTKGGLWWKGSLKGLLYHVVNKDREIISHIDSLGLMTYDLCGDNPTQCAPYVDGPLDLLGQVGAYMQDYTNWLKSDKASKRSLTIDSNGKVTFLPTKYYINSKIQFGFEVNQPAYPKNIHGQLQLTNQLVDKILEQQKESGGVMIWQMYSKQNTAVPDATTTKYTIQQSCKTFLGHDSRYDCNADFPSAQK